MKPGKILIFLFLLFQSAQFSSGDGEETKLEQFVLSRFESLTAVTNGLLLRFKGSSTPPYMVHFYNDPTRGGESKPDMELLIPFGEPVGIFRRDSGGVYFKPLADSLSGKGFSVRNVHRWRQKDRMWEQKEQSGVLIVKQSPSLDGEKNGSIIDDGQEDIKALILKWGKVAEEGSSCIQSKDHSPQEGSGYDQTDFAGETNEIACVNPKTISPVFSHQLTAPSRRRSVFPILGTVIAVIGWVLWQRRG